MRRAIGVVLLAFVGCGGDDGGRVPVTGTVTLDGHPLVGATVAYFPEPGSPGQGGFGKTDDRGRYEIAYDFSGKGLVPGQYRVTVMKPAAAAPSESGDGLIDAPVRGGEVPGVYANPDATPLRATVEPGGASIDFTLDTRKK